MLIISYMTAPYVAYVHIRIPHFARRSKAALFRWAANIPQDTELDLTTMRAYGKLQVSRLPVKDLRQTSSWVSVANLSRVPSTSAKTPSRRRWWMWWALKPVQNFYVGFDRPTGRDISIWRQVLQKIPKAIVKPSN